MPKVMNICKWCGKSYEACRTPNPERVFRWRDVGCSRECAAAYIARVEELRSSAGAAVEVVQPVEATSHASVLPVIEQAEYSAEVAVVMPTSEDYKIQEPVVADEEPSAEDIGEWVELPDEAASEN